MVQIVIFPLKGPHALYLLNQIYKIFFTFLHHSILKDAWRKICEICEILFQSRTDIQRFWSLSVFAKCPLLSFSLLPKMHSLTQRCLLNYTCFSVLRVFGENAEWKWAIWWQWRKRVFLQPSSYSDKQWDLRIVGENAALNSAFSLKNAD